MFSKVNGLPITIVTLCFGLNIHHSYASARPQFYKTLNSHSSLEISPSFSPNQEGLPGYFNIFKQLSDSAHLPSRNSSPLKVKFDPKSLRVSRVAEPPTRPPPLDPVEQSRLQQEYADRSLREQQLAAHGLGRTKPKGSAAAPAPAAQFSSGTFKPFPNYNFNNYRDSPVAHFSGPNFDPVAPDFEPNESEESEEVPRYRRPVYIRPKKMGPKKSYAYDERLFR